MRLIRRMPAILINYILPIKMSMRIQHHCLCLIDQEYLKIENLLVFYSLPFQGMNSRVLLQEITICNCLSRGMNCQSTAQNSLQIAYSSEIAHLEHCNRLVTLCVLFSKFKNTAQRSEENGLLWKQL